MGIYVVVKWRIRAFDVWNEGRKGRHYRRRQRRRTREGWDFMEKKNKLDDTRT